MNGFPGKFIVIDGTDGSGKTTQLNFLKARLEEAGHLVETADFPQYNTKSGGLVEEYLSGKYGQADEVSAYQSSIFFAIDRFDASFKIRRWLQEGKIVLTNRYVSANMGHQGAKISNPLERRVFFNWLSDLEYKIFQIPRPDLTVILHVEAEISQALVRDRHREDWNGKTKDIHEDNLEHLKKAEKVYLEIASSSPDFKLINCTRGGVILSREEIAQLVWLNVNRLISHNELPSTENKDRRWQPIGDILGTNRQIVDNREIIFDQATKPEKPLASGAGYDLLAADYYSIPPYGQALVASGRELAIPEGYVGLIWSKNSLSLQGIAILGGVIKPQDRGEIKVVVKNLSEDMFNVVPGQAIAQILIQPVLAGEIPEHKN